LPWTWTGSTSTTPRSTRCSATDERPEIAEAPPGEPKRTEIHAEPPVNLADAEQPAAPKAEPPPERAARAAVAGVAAGEPELEAPGRGAAPDLRVQLNEAYVGTTWSGADRGEAERHLAGELRAVAGLPIDSFRIGAISGRPAVIISQSLPGGELLEIVQWPGDIEQPPEGLVSIGAVSVDQAPVTREQLEARGTGQTTEPVISLFNRGGFMLALRARISPDSLAALARTIRP